MLINKGYYSPRQPRVDTIILNVELGERFNRDGRQWRISAIGIGFVIGTDSRIPAGCVVESHTDLIRVLADTNSRAQLTKTCASGW